MSRDICGSKIRKRKKIKILNDYKTNNWDTCNKINMTKNVTSLVCSFLILL